MATDITKKDVTRRHIFDFLEKLIYSSRLLLIPFFFCLGIAIIVYAFVIIQETKDMVFSLFSSEISQETLLIKVLSIVDIVMISNLIIMILIGSYSIFVRKIDTVGHDKKPQWLDHISSGSLKVKISMSIVGVSSIHLLKIFIETGSTNYKLIIHAFFIIAAIYMAKTNRIVEGEPHSHDSVEEHKETTK